MKNSWNERRILSTDISDKEWSRLIAVSPESRHYILVALRDSNNVPIPQSELTKIRAKEQGVGPHEGTTHYDITGLNSLFLRRNLNFSIRISIDYSVSRYQWEVRMCKVAKRDPGLVRKRRASVCARKSIGFSEMLRRMRGEILAHPEPNRFFLTVLRRLCP
jgi:hypothetical protein